MPLSNHEIPLVFSAQLAATIGLEEAIVLPMLQQAQSYSDRTPVIINNSSLLQALSFWDANDLQRICKSLADKGLIQIHSAPFGQGPQFSFSLNTHSTKKTVAAKPATTVNSRGANRISPHFKPDASSMAQLQQRGISASFARQQLPEFTAYWSERGDVSHAWSAKFLSHVVRAFERRKSELPFAISSEASAMNMRWQPSPDAMDILKNIGIDPSFIDDSVPEFMLYWQERGDATNTWNSKFIQHVKRQWAKYTSTLKYDTEPKRIAANWQPDPEVFDIIAMANIEQQFAQQCIQEFVLYWKESNQLHSSWNSKYLQHVKYRWAQQHQLQGFNNAGQQDTSRQSTATASFIATHTDRSWADGI